MTNVLITGGSGYLGGDLLDYLKTSTPSRRQGTIYALIRNDEQAKKVEQRYNASPLTMDLDDQEAITTQLVEKKISIVFYLIDAMHCENQVRLLHGLAEVGKRHSIPTHFLHTTGAKLFSVFTGHPVDRMLSDAEEGLFDMQKNASAPLQLPKIATDTNCTVIETGERLGVSTYIFAPCIVYGASATFGNPISIQTRAIVKAAKAMRKLVKPDNLNGTWPVCHVRDNTKLYSDLLVKMINDEEVPHNRHGYYLASPGSVAWIDIYTSAARALAKRGIIDSAQVGESDPAMLEAAGKALGIPPEWVPFEMGGTCTLKADNGPQIGWKPERTPEHILNAMDDEVELILKHI